MPVLRYFVFVGGALLALLFVCNAVIPQAPLPKTLKSASDMPAVRIKSERKWPERVVFDTTVPSVAPVNIAKVDTDQHTGASADTQKQMAREAFAQMGTSELKQQAATSPKTAMPPKVAENVAAKAAEPAALKVADAAPPKAEPRLESSRSEFSKPKRKVAKVHPSRPMIIVAQQPQPHFGFFDSTW